MAESLFPLSEMCPNDMVSVESFLENTPEFLAKYSDKSIDMMHSNYKDFSKFIKSLSLTLGQVDQKTILAYQKHVNDKGLSANSYSQKMSHIRTLLNYIGKRFVYRVRKRTAYGNIRIIDEKDFIKVLDFLKNRAKVEKKEDRYHIKYLRDYIFFKLLYMTGLRKAEGLSLRHHDIFEEAGIYVYQVIIKGGNQIKKEFPKHLIPLIRELQSKEKKTQGEHVFTARPSVSRKSHTPLGVCVVNRYLNDYYQRATGKTGRITVHGIRNISGYAVQRSTNDVYNTKDHLNHQSIHTTVQYLQQIKRRTRTPFEDLERRLEGK